MIWIVTIVVSAAMIATFMIRAPVPVNSTRNPRRR
jgi:hypothetical protein